DVTGSGTNRATTEGGQVVHVWGHHFGPANTASSLPQSIYWVRYGTRGVLQFAGQTCYVDIATAGALQRMSCLSAPGTGFGHWWQVSVGGQASNVLPKNTSYAAPTVTYFDGPGYVDADTRAGVEYNVTLNGLNFGADVSVIDISYSNVMKTPRMMDGVVPGDAAGVVLYQPTSCMIKTPHRAITCTMPPGAGNDLAWTLVVDSQRNTAPTTSYGVPTVSSVELQAPADSTTPVTMASTDGGDEVVIMGTNFGLESLIQTVTFGPSGTEYQVTRMQYIDHEAMLLGLGPGIGKNLRFVVKVADQVSDPSTATISYADPVITSVSPSFAAPEADPNMPVIVTVSGYEFGLLNPNVEVEIAFGHVGDGTFTRVPIVSREPALSDVLDPTWQRPSRPILQQVSFVLPNSIGKQRTIRVVNYLRGTPPTDEQANNLLSQGGAAAEFSFEDPRVSFVSVNRLSGEDIILLGTMYPALNDFSNARRLEITGFNFGNNASVTAPGVQRVIQAVVSTNITDSSSIPESAWSETLVQPIFWDHQRIVALSSTNRVWIRVAIRAQAFDAFTQLTSTSNTYPVSQDSPT
ncbi:hypothetical protein EON62_03260, partial [archaeon]